jgi:hypothetical protein
MSHEYFNDDPFTFGGCRAIGWLVVLAIEIVVILAVIVMIWRAA